MAKRSKTAAAHEQSPERPSDLYYRLHTFLETLRVIKGYEDPLCTLLHALQTGAEPGAEIGQELRELLDEMPSGVYALELNGVRELLEATSLPPATSDGTKANNGASRPAKPAPAKNQPKKVARTR